jgi:ATP-dependent DNA helicase RecG
MRPALLNPLFAGAAAIKGIGRKLDKTLAKLLRPAAEETGENARIVDLLFHLPSGLVDRRYRPHIADLPREGVVTIEVTVTRHRPPPRGRRVPYRVDVADETGTLTLVFFHGAAEHLQRILPVGERRFVSGTVEWYEGLPQIVHPDHVVTAEDFEHLPLIEPIYPLTEGLSGKVLARRSGGARRHPPCRNGRTKPTGNAMAGRISRPRCAPCIIRKRPPHFCPTRLPACALPMTSCWPTSWRCRWCAAA